MAHVIKLVEEHGELAEQILAARSLQRKEKGTFDKQNLAHEIADVLITCMLVARDLDVDIKQSLVSKIKILEDRHKVKPQ